MGLIGFSGVRWLQYQEELAGLVKVLKDEGCKSYLEIGAHHGDTWHYVGTHLPPGALMVAVDWPGKTAGGHFHSSDSVKRAAQDLAANYGHQCRYFFGNSMDPAIVEQVRALGPFDAVLIDGDHSFNGCATDYANYGTLGRIVAFHDIEQVSRPKSCEVHKVYDPLCKTYRHQEFAAKPGVHRGIGVIWR